MYRNSIVDLIVLPVKEKIQYCGPRAQEPQGGTVEAKKLAQRQSDLLP
jgi:hypothetical protein